MGGGGGRASGGRRHPFIPPSKGTPAHTHTPTHIHNNDSDATPEGGICPLSAPAAAATCRSLSAGGPTTPLGRGPRAQGARGGPAKPPGAPGAGPAAPLRARPECAPK